MPLGAILVPHQLLYSIVEAHSLFPSGSNAIAPTGSWRRKRDAQRLRRLLVAQSLLGHALLRKRVEPRQLRHDALVALAALVLRIAGARVCPRILIV